MNRKMKRMKNDGNSVTSNIFLISDTHFSQKNILSFREYYPDGPLIRPGFSSIEEMDELIIENWNKTVKEHDKVYHLGDFSFGGKANISRIASRLNGKKRLILGNHDDQPQYYKPYFQKIMSYREFGNLFRIPVYCCHFPLAQAGFNYRSQLHGLMIHGHLHLNKVPNPQYINVCVENINYTPVAVEELVDNKIRELGMDFFTRPNDEFVDKKKQLADTIGNNS